MKNFLPKKPTLTFVYIFLILSLGLSAQTDYSTRIALHETIDSTVASNTNNKNFKEDYSKFKKQYICQTTTTEIKTEATTSIVENSVPNTLICAVNIDGVSYFKSGGNTYYSIELEADSPTIRFRRWSRRSVGNVG